jgi:hypothetical protein
MKEASIKWADQIRTGKLKRHEVHLALHSTLWKTLSYPLPCTTLSKQQCEEIMATALHQALPAMGVCRNFPRHVVHGPVSHMGLGIPHLHTLQEVARIKDMVHHSSLDTFTGQLYRSSLEALILEVGFTSNIFKLPFSDLHCLATHSLVKSTWEFTATHGISIHYDIELPLPRINDIPLMQLFYEEGARSLVLAQLNKCRLYLRAFHLSDIADFAGTHISDDAWKGIISTVPRNQFLWPKQGKPSPLDWSVWRTFLGEHIVLWHHRLRQPLGQWVRSDDWNWFFHPGEERLYKKRGLEWYYYIKIPLRTRRLSFQAGGQGQPSGCLHKALVIQRSQ